MWLATSPPQTQVTQFRSAEQARAVLRAPCGSGVGTNESVPVVHEPQSHIFIAKVVDRVPLGVATPSEVRAQYGSQLGVGHESQGQQLGKVSRRCHIRE